MRIGLPVRQRRRLDLMLIPAFVPILWSHRLLRAEGLVRQRVKSDSKLRHRVVIPSADEPGREGERQG